MLSLRNPDNFRQIIYCSLVSERSVLIEEFNKFHNPPGIKPEETRFLDLVKSISSGCKIVIGKGGSSLQFSAGIITCN